MKTLKTAIIATFLALSIVSLASDGGFNKKPKQVVNITFDKAVQNIGLVMAMHQQLNPDFLSNFQLMYVEEVTYHETLYRIRGTFQQWEMFFLPKWKIGSETNPGIVY